MPLCRVDIIRKRGERLGTVVANSEVEAIKVAINTFEIGLARRNRIVVTNISNSDDD